MVRKLIDLTGKRFGRLIVLSRGENKGENTRWLCRCDCGEGKDVSSWNLRSGQTRSCGCLHSEMMSGRFVDLTGQRFGKLTAVSVISKGHVVKYLCRCDCGRLNPVAAKHLRAKVLSCRNCSRTDHGYSTRSLKSPEYSAWSQAKQRCNNSSHPSYKDYGGRGIAMCIEWQNSFPAFFEHVGPRPSSKHSVDRYPDNDGNYEPGNVRWATAKEQAANKRPPRKRKDNADARSN